MSEWIVKHHHLAFSFCLSTRDENNHRSRLVKGKAKRQAKNSIVKILVFLFIYDSYGGEEIAYRLITDADHPGYAHNLRAGATTLWEEFKLYDLSALPNSLIKKDGEAILSLNHHCWGSISAWFFNRVAGLRVTSTNEAEISPVYLKELNFAEAEFHRDKQNICVRWKRTPRGIILTVENDGFYGFINAGDSRVKLPFGKSEYVV